MTKYQNMIISLCHIVLSTVEQIIYPKKGRLKTLKMAKACKYNKSASVVPWGTLSAPRHERVQTDVFARQSARLPASVTFGKWFMPLKYVFFMKWLNNETCLLWFCVCAVCLCANYFRELNSEIYTPHVRVLITYVNVYIYNETTTHLCMSSSTFL
jgi:hypothetical protein